MWADKGVCGVGINFNNGVDYEMRVYTAEKNQ
jgi:hypothetical protein